MHLSKLRLLITLFLVCVALVWVQAQIQSPTTPPEQPLVKLNVIVTDRLGHSVDDVRKEDLQLFDDGNAETISYFSKEEFPVTYGLVMDNSGSLRLQFKDVIAAAKAVVNSNRQDDQTFIIRFVSSDKIETVQELTGDKSLLTAALDTLYVEKGQSAVVDGVYLAADYAMKHRKPGSGRRLALVLVSDGEDRASYYTESDIFKLLGKSDLQVFIIGLVGQLDKEEGLIRKSVRQTATDFLTKLARETGGRAFILRSEKELPDAISQLAHNLHMQYVIGYRPTKKPDQVNRKVQVKVVTSPEHEKWTAITRRVVGSKN